MYWNPCRAAERTRLCSRRHVSSGSDYVFVRRQLWLGGLHKVWLVLGPRPSQLPFGPASLSERGVWRLLRSDKVENGPAKPDKQPRKQGILQNRKGPAGCFSRRCHVVDLPCRDCGECNDHHAGIFCPFFVQRSVPHVLCNISLCAAQIPGSLSKNV